MVDTLPSDVVLLDEVQRQLGIEVKPQGDNPIFLLAFIFFYLLCTPMDYFSRIDISLGTVLGIASVGTFAILLNLGEVKVSGTYFQPAALFSLVFSVIVTGLYASKDPGGTLIYFLISLFFGYVCVRPYGKTIIYAEPFWIPLPFVGLVTFEKFTPLIVSIPYVTFFLFDVLHARRSKHIVVGGAKERDALFHVPGGICAIAIVIVFYSYFMKIDLSYTAREIKRSTLLLVHGVLDGVIHVVQSLVREIVGRVSELLTHIQPR